MTFYSDNQELEAYIPVYDAVPEKWEDARPFIVEQLKKITNAVNIREVGWFLDQELLSGKAFIPGASAPGSTSQYYRQILRKVVDFGVLPDTATKSVAHEINIDYNFSLVFLGAYATDPSGLTSLPIPYGDPSALNTLISLNLDSTNVNITTGKDMTNYTRCFIIIEYIVEL